MTRRTIKPRQDFLIGQSHPVPMPIAAALVYHHLNRHIGNFALEEGYDASICSTALALSQFSDVYHVERGRLLRIPSEELVAGTFEQRGDIYKAASGKVYRSLSMRRVDVMQAMVVLRNARKAIEGARVRAKNH